MLTNMDVSKHLRELITEGVKYVRVNFRNGGQFFDLPNKESGCQNLRLRRGHAWDRRGCLATNTRSQSSCICPKRAVVGKFLVLQVSQFSFVVSMILAS
jgi:hypothetical protein